MPSKHSAAPKKRRPPAPVFPFTRIAPIVVAAFGVCFTAVVFDPGFISPDSIAQLYQGRTGVYDDWHPPLMSAIWGVFDRIVTGPIAMVVFHNLMFWGGLWLLSDLAIRRWWLRCLVLLGVGLSPPFFGLLGTVWKDVGFGTSMLLGTACVLHAQATKRLWPLAVALASFTYALAMRHEGILAVVPACVWTAAVALPHFPRLPQTPAPKLRPLVLGVALLGAMLTIRATINYGVLGAKRTFGSQLVVYYDLAYLSVMTGEWLMPPDVVPADQIPQKFQQIRELWRRGCGDAFCYDFVPVFPMPTTAEQASAQWSHWWSVVSTHLGQQFEMKAHLALADYAINIPPIYAIQMGVQRNNLGITMKPSKLTYWVVMSWLSSDVATFLFRPWVWVVALVAALIYAALQRSNPFWLAAVGVAVGGLLRDAVFLVWWPGFDFRYHWWTAMCVVAVPCILLAGKRHSQ